MLKRHLVAFVFVSCVPFLQTIYSLSLSSKLSNGVLLSNDASGKYAVIIDAGSTGSRVHVLHFDRNLDLVQIGQDFEFFEAIKPGLSSYADDPEAAAQSLKPLLEKAEAVVPKEFRANTPVKVGATAGLRLLKGDSSEKILQAVRDLLKNESSLKYKAEWVTILEGSQEAAYIWAAINYLLGTAGKKYSETVGTIDLGGGSVQMTYAVSKEVALKASKLSNGKDTYIQEKNLLGTTYHLYAYSYLNYGLLAARAEILKVSRNSSHPCILYGYHGHYTYGDVAYRASAFPTGPNMKKCRAFVLKALKINAPCKHKKCTFNGVWNGGGGDGQKNLYVASFFYDRASQVGVIKTNVPSATARPVHFLSAAKRACRTKYKDIKSVFPNINESDRPFTCLDLVYEYSLLVNGFGLNPFKEITLVKKIKYKHSLLETAWPLGSAIDAVSSQN